MLSKSHLLVDVLDELCRFLRLSVSLLAGGQPEVGLGVDVVEARLRRLQLPGPQLHVLQEGQAPLALPRPDPHPQVTPAAPQACKKNAGLELKTEERPEMVSLSSMLPPKEPFGSLFKQEWGAD